MSILSELRKWAPLAAVTLATIAAVVLTGLYMDRRAPSSDPLKELAE